MIYFQLLNTCSQAHRATCSDTAEKEYVSEIMTLKKEYPWMSVCARAEDTGMCDSTFLMLAHADWCANKS